MNNLNYLSTLKILRIKSYIISFFIVIVYSLLPAQTFQDDSIALYNATLDHLGHLNVGTIVENNRIIEVSLSGSPFDNETSLMISHEIEKLTSVRRISLETFFSVSLPKELEKLESLESFSSREVYELKNVKYLGSCKNLKFVTLNKNLTSEELPRELWKLRKIEELTIYDWIIDSIPSDIGNLKMLRKLNLSDCYIKQISPEIGKCQKLEYLDLKGNYYLKIPNELYTCTSLIHLDFSTCYMDTISPDIGNLTNLRILYLHTNRLNSLPKTITKLQSIQRLYLAQNSILAQNLRSEVRIWADKNDPEWWLYQRMPLLKCTTFTNANDLPFVDIKAISFDSLGNWWFGSNSRGIYLFNGSTWKIIDTTNGLVNNCIQAITTDKDNVVWITTASGVSSFNGTVWKNYDSTNGLASNNVQSVSIDKNGNKWFGCSGTHGGVSLFDSKKWITYRTSEGLLSNDVKYITIDCDNKPWVGSDTGINFLEGNDWKHFTEIGNKKIVNVWGIVIDPQKKLWVALQNKKGLESYKYLNNEWIYTFDPFYTASSITFDWANRLWIASDEYGVCMYDGFHQYYFRYTSTPERCHCIVSDHKNKAIWIGKQNEVLKIQLVEPMTSVTKLKEEQIKNNSKTNLILSQKAHTNFLQFFIANKQQIDIALFDLKGRCVQKLYNGYLEKGFHTISFFTPTLSNGLYICRLKTQHHSSQSVRYVKQK